MKLLQNVFLAIFLIVSVSANAQIPGYMGKRFLIDAEIQAFPAIFTPTAQGNHLRASQYDEPSNFGIHSRYGLGVGYALSRHQMVKAYVNYLKTGMDVQLWTPLPNGVRLSHDLVNVLTALTFDLAYSRTKLSNGHIAPLGKQRAYHVYMTMVNGNNSLYQGEKLISNRSFGGFDAKHTFFGLGYSVTYNKVIADQFIISYGWRINLSAPLTLLRDEASYDDLISSPDLKTANLATFKSAVETKFLSYDMMQFKIGFGLLR